jgi:hypothetical protein
MQFRGSLRQVPSTQRSFTVQASASTQSPSVKQQLGTPVCVQPVLLLQPSVVQGLPSLQFGAAEVAQAPAWQVSRPSQKSRSLHDWPFGTAVKTQPLAGLQESVVHTLPSLHGNGSLEHALLRQRSLTVQALASAQSASLVQHAGVACCVQPVCGLQPSIVHTLPSLQLSWVPGVQPPP